MKLNVTFSFQKHLIREVFIRNDRTFFFFVYQMIKSMRHQLISENNEEKLRYRPLVDLFLSVNLFQ